MQLICHLKQKLRIGNDKPNSKLVPWYPPNNIHSQNCLLSFKVLNPKHEL